MELGGWERAHGYAANEHLLEKYGDRVPVRENEWDNRHFWRVSNAEQLAMSEDCGIINLSHFHMTDIEGPDHVALMEWLCAAKIGGDANIGKGIYTHFLDDEGMVRADFTVIRMADRCRMVNGADAGPRDFHYMRRVAQDKGFDVTITDVSEKFVTIGIWGPNARVNLAEGRRGPGRRSSPENFPFAAIKPVRIAGKDVTAFRISYVGEQGWELHMAYEDGLAVWDALRATGVMAVGVETYANTPPHGEEPAPAERRPADRVQPARGRPRPAEGQGGGLPRQGEASRVPGARAPAGDALHAGDDRQCRCRRASRAIRSARCRSSIRRPARRWSTSSAGGPSPPRSPTGRASARTSRSPICRGTTARKAAKLAVQYFGETYPVEVVGVGYKPLYDPENAKPRS